MTSIGSPALPDSTLARGEVAIVGAGPGDPGLLTLRALSLMEQADALVFDRLVSSGVLEMVPARARRYYAGKSSHCRGAGQDETNALMVRLAREGRRVVRLKGGDPCVFGRGGEEAEYLLEHGIDFRVVPGITSAQGCAAWAGFPLTHRDHAQSVTFVTGHCRADGELALNWSALAAGRQTLVFYMGLANAGVIAEQLQVHGLPADHPVALIERGTTAEQRRVITSLGEVVSAIEREHLQPPTLIVVGEVVQLAEATGRTEQAESAPAEHEIQQVAL
jgi:uroporphyrin-III C-methyltransferase/precorrin-2 dehydrogenase/sirohydrochlorin ferrochelatase